MSDHDTHEEQDDQEAPKQIDADVPEADALDQARSWGGAKRSEQPRIPDDVNPADALEQSQEVGGSDVDDDRR